MSTRKVDDLVRALGADTGISTSEVSRICADLDAEVGAFRDRVVSPAVVIATGARADGWREVLGFAVGDSEDGAFLSRVDGARDIWSKPGAA